MIAHAQYLNAFFLFLMWTCCGCVLDHRCLDAGVSIRLLDCSYFSIISIQGYSQAWPHAPSYSFYKWYMRILRVVYGIYTTCTDQSDFSICYNYDLNTYIPFGCLLLAWYKTKCTTTYHKTTVLLKICWNPRYTQILVKKTRTISDSHMVFLYRRRSMRARELIQGMPGSQAFITANSGCVQTNQYS